MLAGEPWRGVRRTRRGGPWRRLPEPSARIEALLAESVAGAVAGAAPRRPRTRPAELAVARALGAAWLDEFVERWRHVALEISGDDLIAAGVPQGPAVGLGLAAALDAKLDGAVAGRDAELALALEIARGARLSAALAFGRWNGETTDGARWLEARLPGARAAFTTRLGGVSEGDFAELNVGLLTADSPTGRAREPAPGGGAGRARSRGLPRRPPGPRRRRSRSASAAPAPNPWTDGELLADEADGQLTANPELTPLVQVADCLPVAVRGERGVGMLHCGWRGLGGRDRRPRRRGARRHGGRGRAGHRPVLLRGRRRGARAVLGASATGSPTGRMLDLPEVARRLLERAGVGEIEVSGLCTRCNPELFYSHRRDGERAGRQAGLAWLEADG